MYKAKRIEAFEKVESVIESCETIEQLENADNMLKNFKALYGHDNEYSQTLNSIWMDTCIKIES